MVTQAEVQQEIVMMANEFRRLNRQIEDKTAQLDNMLRVGGNAGDFPLDYLGARPRRYSVELTFTPGDFSPQENGVVIDNGTIFRAAYLESTVRAVGTAADGFSGVEQAVQVTLPWNDRLQYFDYLWSLRDTGTDREWVDRPQPSLFGGGGYLGPLWFPRRNVLGGGSTIFASVTPWVSVADASLFDDGFFRLGTIQSYIVQLSLVGHDVPDRSSL